MTTIAAEGARGPARALSLPGSVAAVIGLVGLALPFAQFRPNRIAAGEAVGLAGALGPAGALALAGFAIVLLAAASRRLPGGWRAGLGGGGVILAALALGRVAATLTAEAGALSRVGPGAGFWMLLLALGLIMADGVHRLGLGPRGRWALLVLAVAAVGVLVGSGALDQVSVMREYAVRAAQFQREALRHLLLAFASLGAALVVGLPLGILAHAVPRLRAGVLGVLDVVQTIPSLALFGLMIPLFGWVAANVPGAAAAGIAGIGVFPALVALFLYSLLPVVANMVVGLDGVAPGVREAAAGLGMTRAQALWQVHLPLTLPVVLAAVRIVLVQNIGLAVIAGLIGGGGFGTFVFQGLNQTAMDLILLGALPTIALALVAGIALDIAVAQLDPARAGAGGGAAEDGAGTGSERG